MKLIPYKEFGSLRLRSFCPNDDSYKEAIVERKAGHYLEERIYNGVNFWRWSERPDELAQVFIWSANHKWPEDAAAPVLSAIGLNLQGGLTYDEVTSRFTTPPQWRSKEGRSAIFRIEGDSPYEVNCTFTADKKLDAAWIYRLDIKMPLDDE